jgi:hypothetical protein
MGVGPTSGLVRLARGAGHGQMIRLFACV